MIDHRNPFASDLSPSLIDLVLGLAECPARADVESLLADAGYDVPQLEAWLRHPEYGIQSALAILLPLTPPEDPDAGKAWEERLCDLLLAAGHASQIPSSWAQLLAREVTWAVAVGIGAHLEVQPEGPST